MQIRRITGEGRVVSRVRALYPTAAPHAWEATEGVRLTAPAEGNHGTRNGETVEVWLDDRSLAAIDAIRKARSASEAAILEDAGRYRRASAAINTARRTHGKPPTLEHQPPARLEKQAVRNSQRRSDKNPPTVT